ncbi:MAG: nucleotidyltransferase domain-containing protein [Cecembia sp.]
MDSLGQHIRKLREERKLPLRTVAAFLDIDQAILSKIERGKRKANREQVLKLAQFFDEKATDLLVLWLSDKLLYEVADEDMALEAIKAAEEQVGYKAFPKMNLSELKNTVKNILKTDGRVAAAWLFGSIVTKEADTNSDIDIIVELKEEKNYSMFDLLDIAFKIERSIDRKVDLVEKGQLKDFALNTAEKHLLKIYG